MGLSRSESLLPSRNALKNAWPTPSASVFMILMRAGEQSLGPSARRRVAFGDVWKRRARSMDQQLARIFVAPLADVEKPRFAASGRLTWDQLQPRHQIATVFEGLHFSDRRDHGRRDHDADAGDCRQCLRIPVLSGKGRELRVEAGDAPIKFPRSRATIGDQ